MTRNGGKLTVVSRVCAFTALVVALLAPLAHPTEKDTLLVFTARWSAPCVALAPEIEKARTRGLNILTLDAKDARVREFGIQAVPAFVLLGPDGKVRSSGAGAENVSRALARIF